MTSLPDPLPKYYSEVAKLRKITPCLREGQAHMIVLSKDYPWMYKYIHGTEDDPFYDDRRMGRFKSSLLKLCLPAERDLGYEEDEDGDNEITINLNLSWPFL